MKQPPKLPKSRQCGQKIQHPTRLSAEQHRERLIQGGASADSLSVYRCRSAPRGDPHWHVGHTPGVTWSR